MAYEKTASNSTVKRSGRSPGTLRRRYWVDSYWFLPLAAGLFRRNRFPWYSTTSTALYHVGMAYKLKADKGPASGQAAAKAEAVKRLKEYLEMARKEPAIGEYADEAQKALNELEK